MTNRRLRILHVIDYFYPILGYQETFLVREHSRENETLVITSDHYARALFNVNKELLKRQVVGSGLFIEEGIKVLRLPTLFDIELFRTPWLIGLEDAVIGLEPDVMIVHNIVGLTSIRIARLKSKLPSTELAFDDHVTYAASRGGWTKPLYKIFRKMFTSTLLNSADAFVAVTEETKRFMQEVYGIPRERITIIPLGIDINRFHNDPEARDAIREKYGIRENDTVFVYAGKIVPRKGIHLLIEASLELCKNHGNVKFMIVGGRDHTYFVNLKKRILKTSLEDRFLFIDAVPNSELYKYYSAADVGVWPLECSITMLEATACGLPIIISDKSGVTEIVSWRNGLLYKEPDYIDMADKMALLIDDKLRKKMSKISVDYAKTLDWENIAQRFLDILKR
jgi:glycosyltransferase involved in cell wall biosynthesis